MSFKLQDRIQRTKGLPGKYKRLLLAMASHARNDGTNIIAAKTTLAAEMGTDRRTVNRNMDSLLVCGLAVVSEAHQCRNGWCPKGSKHYTERGNHWTQAYNIDLVAAQNVTPLPKKVVRHFVQESYDILSNSRVTKCPAKQGLYNPAPLGSEKEEASALTSGSEQVSESASKLLSGGQTPHTEDKTNPEQLTEAEFALMNEIQPVRNQETRYKEDLAFILDWTSKVGVDAIDLLRYNRSVKKGGLYIRTPKGFATALEGDSEGKFTLLNEYVTWRNKSKPKPKTTVTAGTGFDSVCVNCDCEGETVKDSLCDRCRDKNSNLAAEKAIQMAKELVAAEAKAKGKGFDVEEAE
jgi:hypothetical protein